MDNKLLIKILKLLEETYPECYHIGKLIKKLDLSLDGEFLKITKYLKEKKNIKVVLKGFDGAYPQRERLQQNDEISITPEGIDFLVRIKLIEVNEKRNRIITLATIIIALATVVNLIVAIFFRG